MTEREHLMPIIVKHFNSLGYYCVLECMVAGYCDVVACKWSERVGRRIPTLLDAIAIELKISNIASVISQSHWNLYHVNASYAAMPLEFCRKMKNKSLEAFKDKGVGLLGVDTEIREVTTIIESKRNLKCENELLASRLWKNKVRNRDKMEQLLNGESSDLLPKKKKICD